MNGEALSETEALAGRALVLGATGGIGSEIADKLLRRGWQVIGLARDIEAAAQNQAIAVGIVWQQGDALCADDVQRAAQGTYSHRDGKAIGSGGA